MKKPYKIIFVFIIMLFVGLFSSNITVFGQNNGTLNENVGTSDKNSQNGAKKAKKDKKKKKKKDENKKNDKKSDKNDSKDKNNNDNDDNDDESGDGKEKKDNMIKEGDLPPEVKELFSEIEKTFGGDDVDYELSNGSQIQFDNSELMYSIYGAKKLKDGIKGLDQNIKIQYMLSKMTGFDSSGGSGGIGSGESLYTYTTLGFYIKSKNTIGKIYLSTGNVGAATTVEKYRENNKQVITTMLNNGWGYSAGFRENLGAFGRDQLGQCAWNGGCFQIYRWCDIMFGNTHDRQDGQPMYVAGGPLGGSYKIYGSSNNLPKGGPDLYCGNKLGVSLSEMQFNDAKFIELGKMHAQVDPERAKVVQGLMGGDLNYLSYLGKELQYMHQFYNFVSFSANKIGKSANTAIHYMYNGQGKYNYHLKTIFEKEGIDCPYEEFKKDSYKAFNYINSTSELNYSCFERNKAKFYNLGATSPEEYREILLLYFYGSLGSRYNGTGNAGYSYVDNGYASFIPDDKGAQFFGEPVNMTSCKIKTDGGQPICGSKDKMGASFGYLIYMRAAGRQTYKGYLNHLKYLKSIGKLKKLTL